MNEWIDLTVLIDENYLEYPGDVPFEVKEEKLFAKDNYNMKRVTTNMHIGTHIDAPKHVLDLVEGVESIDINKVIGKAIVLKPRIVNGIIHTKDLMTNFDREYNIVIINTDHSQYLNTNKYYDYPVFERNAIEFFIKKNIEVLAIDMPSPKYSDEEQLDMHKDLLSRNILIVENVTNLDSLKKYVEFVGLPLKMKGFEGSMIRCVAKNI
jgi:kynurenine formamidase